MVSRSFKSVLHAVRCLIAACYCVVSDAYCECQCISMTASDDLTRFVFQAVETLLDHLELDKRSYRLGLSQVRLKAHRSVVEEKVDKTARYVY